jgi:NDP-sugar pyrophosphorylase family protein
MKCLLLAAGRGERLRPLTDETPKPLIQIGDEGIIRHTLELLDKYGITEIYINVCYKFQMMLKSLGDHYVFSYEDKPLGTAGAIKKLEKYLSQPDTPFLVANGDTLLNLNIKEMYQQHLQNNAVATIFTKDTAEHNGGVFIFSPEIFKYIPERKPCSIHEDLIPLLIKNKEKIRLYDTPDSYYFDCGTIEKLTKARDFYFNQIMSNEKIEELI